MVTHPTGLCDLTVLLVRCVKVKALAVSAIADGRIAACAATGD